MIPHPSSVGCPVLSPELFLGKKTALQIPTKHLDASTLEFPLTNFWTCYTIRYVRFNNLPKSFPSYHIPANPAVSCDYALFCATAVRFLSFFQYLPPSFYPHGVVTPSPFELF